MSLRRIEVESPDYRARREEPKSIGIWNRNALDPQRGSPLRMPSMYAISRFRLSISWPPRSISPTAICASASNRFKNCRRRTRSVSIDVLTMPPMIAARRRAKSGYPLKPRRRLPIGTESCEFLLGSMACAAYRSGRVAGQHREFDLRETGRPDCARAGRRKVDNPALDIRPTIIDPNDHGTSIVYVCDFYLRSKWKRLMRRC